MLSAPPILRPPRAPGGGTGLRPPHEGFYGLRLSLLATQPRGYGGQQDTGRLHSAEEGRDVRIARGLGVRSLIDAHVRLLTI